MHNNQNMILLSMETLALPPREGRGEGALNVS
jgi:hypothetical protein